MRKSILIGSMLVGLIMTFVFLLVGVFAATNQLFFLNNSIYIQGVTEYLDINLNGVVTGTTRDGDPLLSHNWRYDYSDPNAQPENLWNIEDPLSFNTKGIEPGEECITYTFSIENFSTTHKISITVCDIQVNEEVLSVSVVNKNLQPVADNMIQIDRTISQNNIAVGIIKVQLRPAVPLFESAEPFSFKVVAELIA